MDLGQTDHVNWPNDLLGDLRRRVSESYEHAIMGEKASPISTTGDAGWFGPDSAVWQVHADDAMLIGGLRSLLIQTLHPLAMAGVAGHSDYRSDPWGRLRRTVEFLGHTTYGTSEEAEQATAVVRRVHDRVAGIAPDGRNYSANDPELLLWVHATEVDSFLRAYLRYGSKLLTRARQDQYVAEMARVAVALGAERVPTSVRELRKYLANVVGIGGSAQARDAVKFLLAPPLSLPMRAAYSLVVAGAIDLLPMWARFELRLPMPPVSGAMITRPSVHALLNTLRWARPEPENLRVVRERAARYRGN